MTAWYIPKQTPEELPKKVSLNKPDISILVWKLMEGTDWRFLPYGGGLLDQPDWLLMDLLTISNLAQMVKEKTPGAK